jgi:hypothetical protein
MIPELPYMIAWMMDAHSYESDFRFILKGLMIFLVKNHTR